MTAVRFERRGGIYAVTFRYDADLVDVLKLTVPSYARRWSPPRREWEIEAIYVTDLAAAMTRHGHTVVGLETSRRREVEDDPAQWARILFKRVGPARAPLAYRLLSRVCHPDHGGDHQLQVELNQAHAELTTETRRRTA